MVHAMKRSTWSIGLCLALSTCALSACATQAQTAPSEPGHPGASMIQDGQTFSMHTGETVTLADHSALRYVRLVNDSRCPPGVQCIWAGDAEVAFEWTPANGAADAFSLHTGKDPRSHDLAGRRVSLVSLERGEAPTAQLRVDATP